MRLIKVRKERLVVCVLALILLAIVSSLLSRNSHMSSDPYSYENSLARGDRFAPPYHEETVARNISARFSERHKRLREVCDHDNIRARVPLSTTASRVPLPRFLFPTTGQPTVLYCPVPRVGTSYLRRVIAAGNGMDVSGVNWKERFHVRNVTEGYDKAVLFLFTREPYSRLLSSYIHTLWLPNEDFRAALGGPIIGAVREDPTMAELACGNDVTFQELIRYVIESMVLGRRISGYFVPSYKFCQVCSYDYGYIGHMETFSEDAAHIMSSINLTVTPQFEGLQDNEHTILNNYIYLAYTAISADNERCSSKLTFLLRVWRALQIRGLISSQLRFPIKWDDTHHLKRWEFRQLVLEAYNKSKLIFQTQDRQMDQPQAVESKSRERMSAQVLQRKMALASAWNIIPIEDRMKIRKLFDKEFKLFGYDPYLEDVFSPKVKIDEEIFDLHSA